MKTRNDLNASWEDVLASVNPEHDVEIGTLLARIRASHGREPRAGLLAIDEGCRLAIEQNDTASVIDALTVTVRNLPALPVGDLLQSGHERTVANGSFGAALLP